MNRLRETRDETMRRRNSAGRDGRPGTPGRRFLALGLGLLLSGCVAGGKPAPPQPAPQAQEQPGVTRLTDGREGFVIRELAELDGDARDAFDQAVKLLQDEAYAQAAELLEKVVAGVPPVSAPYVDLAIAYRRTDRPDQAEAQLKKALALVPGHPVASNEYGLLLREAGRFAEARTVYEQSLAAFPEYQPAHRNLGILCDLYLNDPQCALEQYQLFSDATPADDQVKIWIADVKLRLGGQQ